MGGEQARIHHYVPRWYQRGFLRPGQGKFFYLDLHPETVVRGKVKYQRKALLHWGPANCFYKDDLYTLKLGGWTTDQIEKRFFGKIDSGGRQAVSAFGDYNGYSDVVHRAFRALPEYMDAQRFRTPGGLDQLKKLIGTKDQNAALLAMQRIFRFHTTMWMEGVWEIVRARRSPTKFIVSDEPVSFFNRRTFPSECEYPGEIELDRIGTRTIFPLNWDACLIISHLQLVRNPWTDPKASRVNARAYQGTVRYLLDTQFGHELEEDEVLRINYILKKRATRHIAASEEAWLYPEKQVSATNWSKLDDDWFLFPNPWKVRFSGGIAVGYKDGSSWAADEYGRHPGGPGYQDRLLHEEEWDFHIKAQREWAKKRTGRDIARVEDFSGNDTVGDGLMREYL